MIQALSDLFSAYSKAVSGNPALGFLSIYFAGIFTWLIRNLPSKIYNFVLMHTTTSMQMHNSGDYANERHYQKFMAWFMESTWSRFSRNIQSIGYSWEKTQMAAGNGNHFFFYKGRLFWFRKATLPSPGTNTQKEEIYIATFGRSHKPLIELVAAFRYVEPPNTISVYVWASNHWDQITSIKKRAMDTVFIDPVIKKDIVQNVKFFVENRQWFTDRGVAYKVGMMFRGISGSGKTSIAKAIASDFDRDMYILDLSTMSNATLQRAVMTIGVNSLLLIEDIDAATDTVKSRDPNENKKQQSKEVDKNTPTDGLTEATDSLNSLISGLTLAGILNALDGMVPLDDVIVCTTTNHPEKLDSALTRKSRIDFTYDINEMASPVIWSYFSAMYPKAEVPFGVEFVPVAGCDVQAAFRDNPYSPEGFINDLAKVDHSKLLAVA